MKMQCIAIYVNVMNVNTCIQVEITIQKLFMFNKTSKISSCIPAEWMRDLTMCLHAPVISKSDFLLYQQNEDSVRYSD